MNEKGSSILEVLIAVMILALAGSVLIGGLYMSKVITDHTSAKQNVLEQLDKVAQELKSQPFIPCSTNIDDVYPTPVPTPIEGAVLKNITLKIEILDATTNTWETCSKDETSPNHGVQKITITADLNNEPIRQVILKTRG